MRDAIRFLGEHSPVPIHCIPNAGLPLQGPDGETIFPEQPEPLAETLGEFVERYGVGIVGGCCGTTPDAHRARSSSACGRRAVGARPRAAPAARVLDDRRDAAGAGPAPTLVGERVNSQGSRKAKELLLADDYDGLVQVAEDQVEGGAHVLDVCVALTERHDEDEQMRRVVKKSRSRSPRRSRSTRPSPTSSRRRSSRSPGRAIVNSINLEAGRDKLDPVVPLAIEHGAALIALTIDEVGWPRRASASSRSPSASTSIVCDEHGLDPQLLIFDALTFTLTTGDDEWKPSAVETIEGIRAIKAELPGV